MSSTDNLLPKISKRRYLCVFHGNLFDSQTSFAALSFLQYGPFRPQMQVGIPLWLAMILKKQGKCNIIPPSWLDVTTLRSVIESERGDDIFQVSTVCMCGNKIFKFRTETLATFLSRLCLFTISSSLPIYASMLVRICKTGTSRTIWL